MIKILVEMIKTKLLKVLYKIINLDEIHQSFPDIRKHRQALKKVFQLLKEK